MTYILLVVYRCQLSVVLKEAGRKEISYQSTMDSFVMINHATGEYLMANGAADYTLFINGNIFALEVNP